MTADVNFSSLDVLLFLYFCKKSAAIPASVSVPFIYFLFFIIDRFELSSHYIDLKNLLHYIRTYK